VRDGVVTLGGTAKNSAQKELTEVYAREIEGVRSVTNNIVVVSNPPSDTVREDVDDASITGQIKYELVSHKATSALKTKVVTDHGVVVITGEASNDAERSLVTKLAESIRGVQSVDNRMTVKE
jgi:osmotically-inducible protein OsmY